MQGFDGEPVVLAEGEGECGLPPTRRRTFVSLLEWTSRTGRSTNVPPPCGSLVVSTSLVACRKEPGRS